MTFKNICKITLHKVEPQSKDRSLECYKAFQIMTNPSNLFYNASL